MKTKIINLIKYTLVFFTTLFVAIYIGSFAQIIGSSMEPNYQHGSIMLLNKIHYKVFSIKRNDVITFITEDEQRLIKRVIGLPGEKIEYIDNTLYINDTPYQELDITAFTEDFSLNEVPGNYLTIPQNMYLVLGDNREDSYDSRDFGLIKESDIIGKCSLTIWPFF